MNILYKIKRQNTTINCIENLLSPSSIVRSITILKNIVEKLELFSDKSTSLSEETTLYSEYACVRSESIRNLKVFRRKTRPFLIFSMQARSAEGAFDTLY